MPGTAIRDVSDSAPRRIGQSGARSIGANRLGNLCAEMEDAAGTGRVELIAALWTPLQVELEVVGSFLDSTAY
jgi:HPt (histidine-containing phosphotransfer) domain-containing protein